MINEEKLEQISALMDGEISGKERDTIIENLESDTDTRSTWGRYHIIADTMRQTMPRSVDTDLASRLNSMLDSEPTVLAPKPGRGFNTKQYLKPVAGLAVAASLTAAIVLSIQNNSQQNVEVEGSAPQVAIIDSSLDPLPSTEPAVEATLADASSVRTVKYESTENSINSQRLNRYIMNHNQHNSRMGAQGVSPHARLVGHETN